MALSPLALADGLVPVDDARRHVLGAVRPILPIEVPIVEAFGCVLAQDVRAPEDLPGFASSAMDGFAVRAADVAGASITSPVDLGLVEPVRMGRRPEEPVGPGQAARIATGAPIPDGADAIVPIEDVEFTIGDEAAGVVHVVRPTEVRRHIRASGEDVKRGELLLTTGTRLAGPEVGILAASGITKVPVHPRPRVVIFSTGDELVPPTQEPDFGQIRDSNAYLLHAALRDAGAQPYLAGIVPDDTEALREAVSANELQADAFISSGGVSVGDRDVVKAAFGRSGEVDFYRVAMQPGMPQGFGVIDGKPFFGLPGNPVSVFVSFEVFVRPAILRMAGRRDLFRPEVVATLDQPISGPRNKTQFARVHVRRVEKGLFAATPTGGRGSHLMATVVRANGLAVIPTGTEVAPEGTRVRVMLYRSTDE